MASGGNWLWVVWGMVVIYYGMLLGSGGNLLCVIVFEVVVIFCGLWCGEWW